MSSLQLESGGPADILTGVGFVLMLTICLWYSWCCIEVAAYELPADSGIWSSSARPGDGHWIEWERDVMLVARHRPGCVLDQSIVNLSTALRPRRVSHPRPVYLAMRIAFFLATLFASAAHADECDLKSITSVLKKITELPKVDACASTSGFGLSPPSGIPDAAQLSKICSESSCMESVSAIVALGVPSCTLALLNNINIREIMTQIQTSCKTQTAVGEKHSSNGASDVILRGAAGGSSSNTVTSTSDIDKSCQ